MKLAETVTFGGSQLDRNAALRKDAAALTAAFRDPAARVLPLWRGKPLVSGAGRDRLGWLSPGHEIFQDSGAPIYLGEDGGPRFAVDLSAWEPAEIDAAATVAFFDQSEQHHPALPPDHLFAELRRLMARLSPRDAELAATSRALLEWHRTHEFCARCGHPSDIVMAGWQRTCPACGAHHFPRTDPVVIMLITQGNAVLLGRSPGWPDRMFSLLAGFVEPGETLEAAVRRETREEAGVEVAGVAYLASQPWPFPASLMIGCHGHAISRSLTPDPAEIEDLRWLSREALLDAFAGRHPDVAPPREGSIANFLMRNWLADRLD
ncbi:NAD(+) diphosphatase [Halodurantibacterium flavum]|uniref:NAD(+) diphosphatase n=1 Tax=Halodurantibacterium flavum TaxID=1382802 RepID=A0ABW4S718_9RHOB